MNAKSDGSARDPRSSSADHAGTAGAAPAADEIDRRLRLIYQAILDEPVPERLRMLIPRSHGSSRRDH
jgi:hypothetical protein